MATSEPSAYVYFLAKVGVRRQTAQGTGRFLQSIEVSCNNNDSINGFEKECRVRRFQGCHASCNDIDSINGFEKGPISS